MENSEIDKLLGALSSTTASIIGVNEKLDKLNESINKSSESSSRLTESLNRLSKWGLFIAGAGVAVAFGHLVLNIIKFNSV